MTSSSSHQQALAEAVQALSQGRLREAEEICASILQATPDQPDALHMLGIIRHGAGDVSQAINLINSAIAVKPDFVNAYITLGAIQRKLGLLDEAISTYRQALDIDPDYAEAHNNLGLAQQEAGDFDQAVASFDIALNLKPNFAEGHYNLACVLQKQGHLDKAINAYKQALSINPQLTSALFNLGNLYRETGHDKQAQDCFQEVLARHPNDVMALNNLALLLAKSGNVDQAQSLYEQALDVDPSFANTHYNLGCLFVTTEKMDAARPLFIKAISLKPDFPEAENDLGLLEREKGELEKAKTHFQNATALNPDYAAAYNHLGQVFKDMGNLDEALKNFQVALSRQPDFPGAFSNILLVLRAASTDILEGKRSDSFIADYIASLPQSPESEILKFECARLLTGDQGAAWKNLRANLPSAGSGQGQQGTKKTTALFHFGRSGTGFLHSLIDSHPQISTLPGVYFSGFFGRDVWRKISRRGPSEMVEQFSQLYEVLFDSRRPDAIPPAFVSDKYTDKNIGYSEGFTELGDNRDLHLMLDRDLFGEHLNDILSRFNRIDQGLFFQSVHEAYEKALGRQTDDRKSLFYHLHKIDAYSLANFLNFFSDSRLLMSVRDPVQSCESWALHCLPKYGRHEGHKAHGEIVQRICAMLLSLDIPSFSTQNSAAIRLEDIKSNPEETIKRLCSFLYIEETPSLYSSTVQGLKWWGDPSSSLYGRTHNTENWQDDPLRMKTGALFGEEDQFILSTLFHPFSVRFGYSNKSDGQFKKDLQAVRPLLDKPLDFEKKLFAEFPENYAQAETTGDYKAFHAVLLGRWKTLNETGTYANMIAPL